MISHDEVEPGVNHASLNIMSGTSCGGNNSSAYKELLSRPNSFIPRRVDDMIEYGDCSFLLIVQGQDVRYRRHVMAKD